jgi:hypothetical protein
MMRWIKPYKEYDIFADAVEVSFPDDTHVFIRSAMNPRDSITVDVAAFNQFINAVKSGQYDIYVPEDTYSSDDVMMRRE